MTQQLEFIEVASGSYIAITTVSANFNLHIEKDYGYPARVAVLTKTAGSTFSTVFDDVVPQTWEYDFSSIGYPKTIQIISSVKVSTGYITTGSGGGSEEEQIEELKDETNELQGGEGSITSVSSEIDNINNLKSFTEGYTQDQKLSDIVGGSVDDENEELILG